MKPVQCHENYPFWIVALSNIFQVSIYAVGAYIIYHFGLVWAVAYLLYAAWLETRVLRKSCVNCYYYGKTCAFGKGKLCGMLFKKGDPKAFLRTNITWKDIAPSFLVTLVPMAAGVALLVGGFSWSIAIALVLLFLLGFPVTGMIRGKLACKYCKQRELGCTALRLFNKNKK
jgi:hypothetical protein